MKVGVVSDTHNNLKNCNKIVALFNEAGVDRVIHTGDITQAKTLVSGTRWQGRLSSLALSLSSRHCRWTGWGKR